MSKSDWVSASVSDLTDESASQPNRSHSFITIKKLAYPAYCERCGHCNLKNDISQLVTRIGCNYKRDSRYIGMRK